MIKDFLIEQGFKFESTPSSGAAYIMNDGSFLCLNKSKTIVKGRKNANPEHIDLDIYLWNARPEFDKQRNIVGNNCNAIKMNDGSNFFWERAYIELPKEKITDKQLESLENWVFMVLKANANCCIEVIFNGQIKGVISIYEEISEYIKNIIKKVYETTDQG